MAKPKFCAHTPPKDSKKWHDLKEHLGDVANLARQFASKFGAGQLAYYAGLWHDLGKYNPEFQQYLKSCNEEQNKLNPKKRRGPPHAIQGAVFADSICPFLSPIVYGHHTGLSNLGEIDLEDAREYDSSDNVISLAERELGNLYPEEDLNSYLRCTATRLFRRD